MWCSSWMEREWRCGCLFFAVGEYVSIVSQSICSSVGKDRNLVYVVGLFGLLLLVVVFAVAVAAVAGASAVAAAVTVVLVCWAFRTIVSISDVVSGGRSTLRGQ